VKITCNINTVGRMIRIATGVILLADGALMWWYGFPGVSLGWRALQAVFVAMGLFTIFEGAVGWCALRAMGVKTRF
jgi:hypothetical protein